jgi:hypothetical protein
VKAAKSIGPCPSYCRADCPGTQRPAYPPGACPGVPATALRLIRKVLLPDADVQRSANDAMGQNRPLYRSRVQVWGRLRRFGDLARERLEFAECRLVQIRSEKMIKSELIKDKGVLVVSPVDRLEASDLEHLAEDIDPYIEQNGRLHGLLVYTEFFPVGRLMQRLFCTLNS